MQYEIQDLIDALKAGRKARGLTQRALSQKAGVPQSHISKIESGAVDIKLSSLIELARALDLEVLAIPRRYLPAVQALVREQDDRTRPAYALEDDEEEGGDG